MKFNKLLYIYFLLFITIFNSSCTTEELNDIANNAGSQTTETEVAPAFVDTIAPTAPSGLITTSKSSNSIVISWDASTDNVAVSGYRVYRNDSFISTSTSTNYIDNTVSANSTYNYVVSAFDAANNFTASNVLTVNTPAQISASDINVKISWQIDETGGSPASGFYVYYGKESGNLTNYVDVGMTTSVVLNGVALASGEDIQFDGSNTYYFSVVSYDADKILFSPHSEEKIANL